MKQTKLFNDYRPKICTKIPLAKAVEIGNQVLFLVSEFLDPCELVGSVRRKKPYCKDLDIVGVATPQDFEKAITNIKREFKVQFKVKGPKVTKFYIDTKIGKLS